MKNLLSALAIGSAIALPSAAQTTKPVADCNIVRHSDGTWWYRPAGDVYAERRAVRESDLPKLCGKDSPVLGIKRRVTSDMNGPAPLLGHHAVNAVYLDGNTSLHTTQVWNPQPSSTFFLSYWSDPAAPNPYQQSMVLWVTNGLQQVDNSQIPVVIAYVVEEESSAVIGYADLVTAIAGPSGTDQAVRMTTQTAPIPRNGLWHLVAEAFSTLTGVGAFAIVEANSDGTAGNMEFGPLLANFGAYSGFIRDWSQTTDWWVGSDDGYYASNLNWWHGNLGEFYVNFLQDMLADPTTIDGAFAAADTGRALGLSYSLTQHDCARPTGSYPNMCHTGNANFFPFGAANTYTLTEPSGILQTAPSDPCDSPSRSGRGCQ